MTPANLGNGRNAWIAGWALATLILDLIYPFIDPRITYTKA